jgi:hypothetical protein
MTQTLIQRQAIACAQARRDRDLAPLRTEVAAAIAAVGWRRAKPLVAAALGPRWHVDGPRGPWWEHVGKRSGARILAGLRALPVQGRLALIAERAPQPKRSLTERMGP